MQTGSNQEAMYVVSGMCVIFVIAHIVRSICLKKGFSRETMKMYIAIFLGTVVADLAIIGCLQPEALTALLGAVIGGSIGSKIGDDAEG